MDPRVRFATKSPTVQKKSQELSPKLFHKVSFMGQKSKKNHPMLQHFYKNQNPWQSAASLRNVQPKAGFFVTRKFYQSHNVAATWSQQK